MNIDPRFEHEVGCMPIQAKWTSIKESDLKALKAQNELYRKALSKITQHAYNGTVMQTALGALEQNTL